ncbi:peptide chain release factor 3, partial [Acinetobacter baumannii]
GCGKLFKGVYHLYKDETYLYQSGKGHTIQEVRIVKGLNNPDLDAAVGEDLAQQLRDELELVKGASNEFDKELFLAGEITPVFFGTALGNFGVDHMLDGLVEWAPAPMPRQTDTRTVEASEDKFTGFVFKIQANMDPKHRDRVAFM